MATVVDTFTMPKGHPVITALQQTLEDYRKQVQTAREAGPDQLRAVGSPTASLAVTLLEKLATCDVGGVSRQQLNDYLDKIEPTTGEPTITREQVELDVQAIKIEQPHDESKAKLLIAGPTWPMRGTVTHAFKAEGVATRFTGVMPAGWLEDEVATWLDVLQQG